MALPGAAGLFGLAIVWVRSSMAVEVPGWDYPPLPGTARKTPESLVRVYEDVFSEEMLAAIDIEVPVLDHLAHNFGSLRNHKRVTFWRGRHGSPRFAIERMIKLLEQVTFPSKLGGPDAFGIVGCKYWVQRRVQSSGVNFHYDKDEGLASDRMIMRPPPLVGVTHMDMWGAPTVVFNQTTINNGNVDAPSIPESGWLIYPKRNKHAIHRGDLHHGASTSLAAVAVPAEGHRVTIVTSWESTKPLEPNCHEIADDELPAAIRQNMNKGWTTFGTLSSSLHEERPLSMRWDGSQGPVVSQKITLNLGEIAKIDVLEKPEPGQTYLAEWNADVRQKMQKGLPPVGGKGEPDLGQAYMGVYELDLYDRSMMNKIFNQRTPVGIVFYRKKQKEKVEAAAMEVTRELLLLDEIGKPPPIETYLADAVACKEAMKNFGLSPQDAPIAVIHFANDDRKYVMSKEKRPDGAEPDLPFRRRWLRRFYIEVLNGKRERWVSSESMPRSDL